MLYAHNVKNSDSENIFTMLPIKNVSVAMFRVLQQMPLWKPATNQGQPVRCFFSVPVTFRNDTD